MNNQRSPIRQFELSPTAKAGVAIQNLHHPSDKDEHDIVTPHRDNHYLLALATNGNGRFNIDFEELSLSAPVLVIIFPGQVHYILENEDLQGWAISFDASLVDSDLQLLLEKGFQKPLFLDAKSPFLQQSATLMDMIEQLQAATSNMYVTQSIHALLKALLHLIASKTGFIANPKVKESRGELIEQEFRQLLKQRYKDWKQPTQYADQLSVSVSHLNDTLKALTGMTTSSHIQHYSILEAKRLLYFTKLSIKEIGYEVGYDEPVYFGKVFKKITGSTPLHFRQQFRD